MGEVTDNHKVVFMFEFVKKLNEIQPSKEHYSSKCIVRNLGWRILIQKKIKDQDDDEFEYVNDSDTNDTLAVKLECGGESKLWCSYARIRLSLIAQKEGAESYSREFENLFSAMNPVWGYSDFIEWDKVVDPVNGFVKDNILKFQAYVVADIPQDSNVAIDRDMPVEHGDWLALFEGNLNDKIVGRISGEFIKMNNIIERALTNEEISEKIICAAVDPVNAVIRTEIQALEKKLEKFCVNHITKVVRELKNMKENVPSGTTNDVDGSSDFESKRNMKENDTDARKVHTAEEETVPVSVLKIMKELIVEQQRTSFGWVPSLYGTRAAYYRTNELHYQPDSDEFRLQKEVMRPLTYNDSESLNGTHRAQEENVSNSGTKRRNDDDETIASKRKSEDADGNKSDDVADGSIKTKMSKPTIVQEKTIPLNDQSEKEILFIGKTNDGEMEIHKVYHHKQLLQLKNKYSSFKILGSDEF